MPNSVTAEESLMVQHQARHFTSSLNDLEPAGSGDETYADSVGLISAATPCGCHDSSSFYLAPLRGDISYSVRK